MLNYLRLAQKGISIFHTAVAGMSIFMCIQIFIAFQIQIAPTFLWILFSFFGTSGILSYSALSSSFPKALSGRVTTSINLLVFIAAFILQWAVGAVINLWEVSAAGNYHSSGYQAGFLAILVLQGIGLVWCLFPGFKKK